jgi:hypothetical protein
MPKKFYYNVFALQLNVHTCQLSEEEDLTVEEVQNRIIELLATLASIRPREDPDPQQKFTISAFDIELPAPPEPLSEKVDRIERVINTMAKRERDVLKLLADSIPNRWK